MDGSARLPTLGPGYGKKVIRECYNDVTRIEGVQLYLVAAYTCKGLF